MKSGPRLFLWFRSGGYMMNSGEDPWVVRVLVASVMNSFLNSVLLSMFEAVKILLNVFKVFLLILETARLFTS